MGAVLSYFSLAIFCIVMIRLVLILTGEMTTNQKVTKSAYWLVGVVLLSFSWSVVDAVFPSVKLGSPFQKLKNNEKLEIQNNWQNNPVKNKDSISVHIRLDMGEKK